MFKYWLTMLQFFQTILSEKIKWLWKKLMRIAIIIKPKSFLENLREQF